MQKFMIVLALLSFRATQTEELTYIPHPHVDYARAPIAAQYRVVSEPALTQQQRSELKQAQLEAQITNINGQIASLNQQAEPLREEINDLDNRIAAFKDRIDQESKLPIKNALQTQSSILITQHTLVTNQLAPLEEQIILLNQQKTNADYELMMELAKM